MAAEITPGDLVRFLRTHSSRTKTVYRPLICPFHDLLQRLPHRSRVLDIGCGGGAWLSMIAYHRNPLQLDGIDVDAAAIDEARKLFAGMNPACRWSFAVEDLDRRQPRLAEYDVVTMVDVHHHLPPDAQTGVFATLGRSLRRGALLLFKDIDGASALVGFNRVHDFLSAGATGHERPMGEVVQHLRAAGFDVVEQFRRRVLWYPHYTVVARKV